MPGYVSGSTKKQLTAKKKLTVKTFTKIIRTDGLKYHPNGFFERWCFVGEKALKTFLRNNPDKHVVHRIPDYRVLVGLKTPSKSDLSVMTPR